MRAIQCRAYAAGHWVDVSTASIDEKRHRSISCARLQLAGDDARVISRYQQVVWPHHDGVTAPVHNQPQDSAIQVLHFQHGHAWIRGAVEKAPIHRVPIQATPSESDSCRYSVLIRLHYRGCYQIFKGNVPVLRAEITRTGVVVHGTDVDGFS